MMVCSTDGSIVSLAVKSWPPINSMAALRNLASDGARGALRPFACLHRRAACRHWFPTCPYRVRMPDLVTDPFSKSPCDHPTEFDSIDQWRLHTCRCNYK